VPVAWAFLRDESSFRWCLREGNGRIELIGSLAPRAAEVSVLRSGVNLA
jgi:hypothetical protein